jgi:hypothetical protein
MPEATLSTPLSRPDLSASMSRANNQDWVFVTQNYLLNRTPEYFVYLYNVSTMEHKVSRPPMLREMTIPARKQSDKFVLATRFPQPLLVPKGNVDSSEIDINALDARRFAMDLINPDNWGLNQDAVISQISGQGNDLGQKGVFWSLNNPPKEEEVKAAYARMEKHYRFLLEQARTVETSNPKSLPDVLSPEHHIAADYFHETTNWHSKPVHKENCPRCGMPATSGAAFHMLEGGGICVGDWDQAIRVGVRSRAQAYEATDDPKYAPKVTPVTHEAKPTQVAHKDQL